MQGALFEFLNRWPKASGGLVLGALLGVVASVVNLLWQGATTTGQSWTLLTGAAITPVSGFMEGTILAIGIIITILVFAVIGAFVGVLVDWRKDR
jgi:hypothetical protein